MKGISGVDMIMPEERENIRGALEHMPAGGTFQRELFLLKKDGTRFPAEIRVSQYRKSDSLPDFLIVVTRDISSRVAAEYALHESDERYQRIIQAVTDYIYTVRVENGRAVETIHGPACIAVTGYTSEEFKHDTYLWIHMVHEDDREAVRLQAERILSGNPAVALEHRIMKKDGSLRWVRNTAVPHHNHDGHIVSYDGLISDITERKEAEERLKSSIREKETLLKEIHHRVKNNLQIITSLLSLQSRNLNNDDLLKYFNEAESRIRSMSLVHEKLYQSETFGNIDFSIYIFELADSIISGYSSDADAIGLKIDAQDLHLTIDQAIPCGLIITELLTNAIKYAFPPGWEGTRKIVISLKEKPRGMAELVIGDNGVGLPSSLDAAKSGTLGLSLVPLLAKQIDGELEIDRSGGTFFKIVFPI
jgi:PAS domain S-box-containing protein